MALINPKFTFFDLRLQAGKCNYIHVLMSPITTRITVYGVIFRFRMFIMNRMPLFLFASSLKSPETLLFQVVMRTDYGFHGCFSFYTEKGSYNSKYPSW